MRGATNQLHACRPGTARATPVPWAMSKAAFWSLWCFVFVLPWGVIALDTVAGRFAALNQDPNDLGLTFALGLPMAWYVSLSQARGAWLWCLYLPLAITAILLTGSRGAVLTGLVGLSIIPWTL